MISGVLNLSRWEWFKLWRRWMPWILLAIMLLFSQLAVWGNVFAYKRLEASGGEVPYGAIVRNGPGLRAATISCNDLRAGRLPTELQNAGKDVVDGLLRLCPQATQLTQRLGNLRANFTLPTSLPGALRTAQRVGLILLSILTASTIGMDYGVMTLRSVLIRSEERRVGKE